MAIVGASLRAQPSWNATARFRLGRIKYRSCLRNDSFRAYMK